MKGFFQQDKAGSEVDCGHSSGVDYVVEDNAQKTYLGAHSSSRERKVFSKQEYQILRDSTTRNGKEGYSPKDRFQ